MCVTLYSEGRMSMGGVVIRECGGGKLSCLWIFEVTELPEKPETNLASQGCVLYSIFKDSRVFKFEIKSYCGKQCSGHLRRPALDSHRVSCMNQCAGCHQLFPSALKWTISLQTCTSSLRTDAGRCGRHSPASCGRAWFSHRGSHLYFGFTSALH